MVYTCNNGNCHPEKTNADRSEAEVDIGFRGWVGDNFKC